MLLFTGSVPTFAIPMHNFLCFPEPVNGNLITNAERLKYSVKTVDVLKNMVSLGTFVPGNTEADA